MGTWLSKNYFDVDGRVVIVTGGSQGMGRGLAKLLAEKGANVVIVARNQQKLNDALSYITSAARDPKTQRFLAISADVTKPEENDRLMDEVIAWNDGNPPDIVWANAGSSHPALLLDTSIDIMRSQMDINYFAAAFLAQATLKAWMKPSPTKAASDSTSSSSKPDKPRHFIVTSSVICFVGLAGYAAYGPAKSALRSLADILHSEVNLYNGLRKRDPSSGPPVDIKIHCVCPGTIASPGLDQENLTKHGVTKMLEEGDLVQSEDEVAAASVKSLEKGGYLITTQFVAHAMRAGALGGSPRNNWLVDTLFSWVIALVWLFVGPDLDSKVFNYGKKNGV